MDKHIFISIFLFFLVDFTVMFALFLPEWIISNVGGEVQIGLWQTCIITKKIAHCYASSVPTEWVLATFFIICGCFFATLAVVTFIGSLKSHGLVQYGRWLGLATLASYCMASILIPIGFTMDAIKGEPFQLPSSFYVSIIDSITTTFSSNTTTSIIELY